MVNKTPPSSDSVSDERTGTTAANSEAEEETSGSDTSIHRRSYLKLLGVSTVPLAAGHVEAAETDSGSDYGYGYGGYGEGGYGGVADETDGTDDGNLVVESLTLSDTSSPNPHVDLQVDWSVSHDASALSEVQLIVRNDNNRLVDGSTIAVDGAQATGSETFNIKHGSGESYVVTLVVSDREGNTAREDATIQT